MKLTLKKSVLLIIAGLIVQFIGALPMIINSDDRLLTASLIISSVLLLVGIVNIIILVFNKG